MAFLLILVRIIDKTKKNALNVADLNKEKHLQLISQSSSKVRVLIQRQIFKPLGISLGLKALEPKSSRWNFWIPGFCANWPNTHFYCGKLSSKVLEHEQTLHQKWFCNIGRTERWNHRQCGNCKEDWTPGGNLDETQNIVKNTHIGCLSFIVCGKNAKVGTAEPMWRVSMRRYITTPPIGMNSKHCRKKRQ